MRNTLRKMIRNQNIFVKSVLEQVITKIFYANQIRYKYLQKIKPAVIFLIIFIIFGCNDNATSPEDTDIIDVDIRMEVQVLDSTYQLYSRPYTQIFFTTYKYDDDLNIVNLDQSDTTACKNGWGVKLLNFSLNSKNEQIVLGAACEGFDGDNYREIIIDYDEAQRRIDTLNHSSIIKTFAIYYK